MRGRGVQKISAFHRIYSFIHTLLTSGVYHLRQLEVTRATFSLRDIRAVDILRFALSSTTNKYEKFVYTTPNNQDNIFFQCIYKSIRIEVTCPNVEHA